MIITKDAKTDSDEIQYSFMLKPSKLEGNFFNLIKDIYKSIHVCMYKKRTCNCMPHVEKVNVFCLRSETNFKKWADF